MTVDIGRSLNTDYFLIAACSERWFSDSESSGERTRGKTMAESQEPQAPPEAKVSEAQLAVHWREEEYYPPPLKFVEQANANDPAIFERFTEDKFPGCFKEYADLLT